MKNVKVKLSGLSSKVVPNIYVDGKSVQAKKNEFGSYELDLQTEQSTMEIAFSRELELKSKLWWLYSLISFIISIFGILEPLYDRKCITIDCVFKFNLEDTNDIKIKFNTLQKSGRAVEIETTLKYDEIKNEYEVDKIAKRRWIIMLVFKLIVWVAIAIVAGYLLATKLN